MESIPSLPFLCVTTTHRHRDRDYTELLPRGSPWFKCGTHVDASRYYHNFYSQIQEIDPVWPTGRVYA